MNTPEKIVARLRSDSGVDPSGVVLQLTIRSGHRNPYEILLPKTDHSGVSELTSVELVGQFKDHWESGLMDHNGTVDSASPVVDVKLFDKRQFVASRKQLLAWPLLKHERSRWHSREDWFEYYSTCRNEEFAGPEIHVNLEKTPEFLFVVRAV